MRNLFPITDSKRAIEELLDPPLINQKKKKNDYVISMLEWHIANPICVPSKQFLSVYCFVLIILLFNWKTNEHLAIIGIYNFICSFICSIYNDMIIIVLINILPSGFINGFLPFHSSKSING